MTSLVTWPFDSGWATFYGWFIVIMRLSGTVMEIWRLKLADGRTDARADAQVILYSVQCYALHNLHRTDKNFKNSICIRCRYYCCKL